MSATKEYRHSPPWRDSGKTQAVGLDVAAEVPAFRDPGFIEPGCDAQGYAIPVAAGERYVGKSQALISDYAGTVGPVTFNPYKTAVETMFGGQQSNPKTQMGRLKVPMLSVIPPAAIIREAVAMQYGAYEAPRKDGGLGYGPYNWRDQPIEYMVYVDAAMRHLMAAVDGEDYAQDSKACHLAHARATLGILIDAIENETVIDNRPKVRKQVATRMFDRLKKERAA